jgi:O-acetyl-ADP-ribose deacetylase (regulator of RNase III)
MNHQRSYRFGMSTLTLRFGDITTSDAQVLVSSDDSYISMGGGVSAAIHRAGGETIALDASKKVPAALGDIVVTSAGTLKAQYVFHAITIGPSKEGMSAAETVEQATRRCMQLLDGLQLSSIAFPAIGTGVARFDYEDVAATMARVIAEELEKRQKPIAATIYLFDRFGKMSEMDFLRFFEEFAARVPRVAERAAVADSVPQPAKVPSTDLASETKEDYKRRRLHNIRSLLVQLEDQRGRLEQQLITVLDGEHGAEQERVRASLKDNQNLRLQYLSELQSLAEPEEGAVGAPKPKAHPLSIFVSSTYKDLINARTAVKEAVARCDLFFRGMEHFGASPSSQPAASLIVEEVRKADVYLGIFGVRYGSIDTATGLSMTELEFREAETQKKRMLLYIIHTETAVSVADIEPDPVGLAKLAALKDHILGTQVPYLFRSVEDLGRQVYVDLERLKAKSSSAAGNWASE